MPIEWASKVRAQTFNGLQTFADGISVSGTATISGDVLFSGSVAHGTGAFDGDGFISAKGLRIGPTATAPAAGSINITGSYLVNGAATPVKSALSFSSGAQTATAAATTYIGQAGLDSTLGNMYWPVPFDCTLRNMFVRSGGAAGGATEKFQYALMLESSVTALSSTTSATENQSEDMSNVVTATRGRLAHIRLITSAAPTVTPHHVSVEMRPL